MSQVNVIFVLTNTNLLIQCSREEKMEDIIQKFAATIGKNANSFLYLYEGKQINFETSFENGSQISSPENATGTSI